jgi:hypothetical protein
MVTIRTSNTHPVLVDVGMSPPNVYLDHCVIGDFSQDSALGERFRQLLLAKRGTLCISALHLVESAGLCPGIAYSRIKDYLSSFGCNFAILDFDPNSVVLRERGPEISRLGAPIDFELTRGLVQNWNGRSTIDLGILLTLLEAHPDQVQRLRNLQSDYKTNMRSLFQGIQKEYRSNASFKENLAKDNCLRPPESTVIEYVYCMVRRICIRQSLSPSDAFDFFHSIVSVSYTNYVVLDRKWADRMRNIPHVVGMSRVFATTEYSSFLDALAA